ncbi:hypothetical protein Tco_0248467 [Tanacetum coccineum]
MLLDRAKCCLPNEAAGSTAEQHPSTSPSPPFSPVRESSPERQPETEWVVPNPVSPGTDWRPWPSVPPPRTPTPPAQTLSFEEPLVFGPVPRPAGWLPEDTQVGPDDAPTTTAYLLYPLGFEETEEEEVPLRRRSSVYRHSKDRVPYPVFALFSCSSVLLNELPQADISEYRWSRLLGMQGQAHASKNNRQVPLVQQLQAEDLAQADVPQVLISELRN